LRSMGRITRGMWSITKKVKLLLLPVIRTLRGYS